MYGATGDDAGVCVCVCVCVGGGGMGWEGGGGVNQCYIIAAVT